MPVFSSLPIFLFLLIQIQVLIQTFSNALLQMPFLNPSSFSLLVLTSFISLFLSLIFPISKNINTLQFHTFSFLFNMLYDSIFLNFVSCFSLSSYLFFSLSRNLFTSNCIYYVSYNDTCYFLIVYSVSIIILP